MQKLVSILLLFLIFGCSSKEQSLMGEWQKVEEHYGGNLGEKLSVQKINNKTYTFEKDHKLKLIADGELYEGVYEIIQADKDYILHTITSSKKQPRIFDSYFRIHFIDSITMKKVSFLPVHPDNQVMYSFGRKDIYEKKE